MSGSLLGIGAAGVVINTLTSVLLRPKRGITFSGGILIPDVVIEEQHTDTLIVTTHPVQQGANISDHAYRMPAVVTVRAAWSNSSFGIVRNILSGGVGVPTLSDITNSLIGGTFSETYAQQVYNALISIQRSRVPFSLATGKRNYDNMLLVSMGVSTTSATEYALMLTATFQEILITSVETTSLPALQSNPQDTQPSVDASTKSIQPQTTLLYKMLNSGQVTTILPGATP